MNGIAILLNHSPFSKISLARVYEVVEDIYIYIIYIFFIFAVRGAVRGAVEGAVTYP